MEIDFCIPLELDSCIIVEPDSCILLELDSSIPAEPNSSIPVEPDSNLPSVEPDSSIPVELDFGIRVELFNYFIGTIMEYFLFAPYSSVIFPVTSIYQWNGKGYIPRILIFELLVLTSSIPVV